MEPISNNRTIGTMDKYELAKFLEQIARNVRNGAFDVQPFYEGLEISSKDLNGFTIHVNGHMNSVIPSVPSIRDQVTNMFHERNYHVQGAWIETLIDEAEYRINSFFENQMENLVEDAEAKFYSAELLYAVAHHLWSEGEVWNDEFVYDMAGDAINEHLPREAYLRNQ